MKERVVIFGDRKNLVGVITEPDYSIKNNSLPCVVILNSGILHHVGPFRLHVVIARHLAARGYVAFRIDVGGIGDSIAVKGAEYDSDQVVSDIRMAMDELSHKTGINEFILMGLCTGAANAHKVSVADQRVSGAIFLDGYAYPTWHFHIKRYLPALVNPVRVINWLMWHARRLTSVGSESDHTDLVEDFGWWKLPPKNEVHKDLAELVDRGVNLLYINSGERLDIYNYENQFVDAFSSIDFKGKLKVIFNHEADHTYSMGLDRDRLIGQVTDWLSECYGT